MYIATSPVYSAVDAKSDMDDLYEHQQEICKEKYQKEAQVECEEEQEIPPDEDGSPLRAGSDGRDGGISTPHHHDDHYNSLKESDDGFPIISDASSYFIAADYANVCIAFQMKCTEHVRHPIIRR